MNTADAIVQYGLIIIGAVEVISNLFHLTRGSADDIGRSAKRQHGELPPDLEEHHYAIKAGTMLAIGVVWTAVGVWMWISGAFLDALALGALSILGGYGIVQAFAYRHSPRVWAAAVVYNVPWIAWMLAP